MTPSRDLPAADVRVAIVAEHASARFGGEAILPLHYFRTLRRRGVEAFLVVHERTRPELDAVLEGERERIRYVRDTWLHKALWRIGRLLPARVRTFSTGWLLHLLTQLHQRPVVRELVGECAVNVVHEPIPVSPRMPSLLCDVGAPVIIGPMNGGMTYPPAFRHLEGRFARSFLGAGRALSGVLNLLVPGKRRAALLLVANERTRDALPPGVCGDVEELVENGVDLGLWERRAGGAARGAERLRTVFVGRLIALKAVDLLLEAVATVAADVDCSLEILGDGPERPRLERLADDLGLRDRVTFRGFLSQAECRDRLADADVLVLPSLHECGGAVVLEAMAMGLPVVATAWGGPADYVDESCGFLVEPLSAEAIRTGVAAALSALHADPALGPELGRRGRARVEERFSWERKIDAIVGIYERVARRDGALPRTDPRTRG